MAEKNYVGHLILDFFLLEVYLDTIIYKWYQLGERFLFRSLPVMNQSRAFFTAWRKKHFREINLSSVTFVE